MQSQSYEFRTLSTQRLFLAVVNQAISDVLENGQEAKEAEQWLLSEDFDALDKLLACPTKTGGIAITKNKSAKRRSLGERQIAQLAPITYCRFANHPGSDRLIHSTGQLANRY